MIPIRPMLIATVAAATLGLGNTYTIAADSKPAAAKASAKAAGKKTPKKPTVAKQTAATLLQDMEKANAYIIKQAQAAAAAPSKGKAKPNKLNPKEKQQAPFWGGSKQLTVQIEGMQKALAAKDPKFFTLLDQAGRSVAQINNGAQVLGVQNKNVLNGVKALSVSYNALKKNYGKQAARRIKGGELTAAEKQQIVRFQTEAKAIYPELRSLHTKVKATNNRWLLRQIDDLISLAMQISRVKGDNVNVYCEVLDLFDSLFDLWYAYGEVLEYWAPAVYTDWSGYNKSFTSYYEYYETTYTSISYSDWSYVESAVSVVDVDVSYSIDISETEITSVEESIEEYSEEQATEEMTVEEMEDVDDEADDEDFYDAEDDEDGDGLEDEADTDDDGDGMSDDEDADDDGDGYADDDEDGDGVADEADTDDDGDGVSDEEDADDDGDGVEDEEEDMDDEGEEDEGDEEEGEEEDDSGDEDDGGDDDGGDDGGDEE